ncbi:phage tail tape measure protein [Brevibacillus composti]|uniref:Phage tail tape measure protein n=1 Tax=Brevibacillus composti TaxID=2796470 RepID=A0A7T5EN76_9BACL|nr:phage tail tape measure protein [Brevibacillus composti]QQE75723.1 phage tail tape measure protein [Brevibacillus composti]QUO42749.1 phage tail tape measure protein [Brevibacillus composti]
MARKLHEVSFAIAGKLLSSFQSSFSAASGRIKELSNTAKNTKDQLKKLEQEYKRGAVTAQQYAAAHQKLTKQLDAVIAKQKQLVSMQSRYNEVQAQQHELAGKFATVGVATSPFLLAAKQAMDFEDAMLGVAKQAQGARDENGKLTQVYFNMRDQIQKLGREIPIATNELAKMVEAGLRMGIPNEKILEFTRNTAKMATAFEMPADEIADYMGKISNVMGIPIEKLGQLGDAINWLDDNAVAKGKDIIGVLLRTGGVLKQVNMNAQQGAALASTFLSLGKSEEVAATATNALIRELAIANQQPKRFQKGLEMLGLTSEQVNKGMVKDAQGTILKVLDLINKLPKERQTEVTTLLFGKEYGDDIAALSGAVGEYRRQLSLLNDPKLTGSMGREFEARAQTTSAQLQILRNKAAEVGVTLGSALLPMVNEAFTKIGNVAIKVAEWAKANPELVKTLTQIAIALGSARLAFLSITGVINMVKIATLALNMAMAGNPIGLIVIAVSTLIGALIYLYQTNDTVRKKLNQLFALFRESPERILALLGPIGMLAAAGIKLYQNWDQIKQFASDLWVSLYNTFASGVNKVVGVLNPLIQKWNELTGSNVALLQEMALDYSVQVRKMGEAKQRRNLDIDGSHAAGISYVPNNGYLAELHRGERVLTARENRDYLSLRSPSAGAPIQVIYSPTIQANDVTGVKDLLQEDKRSFEQQYKALVRQERRLAFI